MTITVTVQKVQRKLVNPRKQWRVDNRIDSEDGQALSQSLRLAIYVTQRFRHLPHHPSCMADF